MCIFAASHRLASLIHLALKNCQQQLFEEWMLQMSELEAVASIGVAVWWYPPLQWSSLEPAGSLSLPACSSLSPWKTGVDYGFQLHPQSCRKVLLCTYDQVTAPGEHCLHHRQLVKLAHVAGQVSLRMPCFQPEGLPWECQCHTQHHQLQLQPAWTTEKVSAGWPQWTPLMQYLREFGTSHPLLLHLLLLQQGRYHSQCGCL